MNPQNAGRNRDKQPSTWYEWRKVMSNHTDVRCGERLVLFALCERVNDEGHCFPSRAYLAKWCGLSKRHVTRMIASLEARGLIVVKRGYGRSKVSHYQLIAPALGSAGETRSDTIKGDVDDRLSSSKGDKSTLNGDIDVLEKVTPVSPGTYIEPLKNPGASKRFETGNRGDFEITYRDLPASIAREIRAKIARRTEKEQQTKSQPEDQQG